MKSSREILKFDLTDSDRLSSIFIEFRLGSCLMTIMGVNLNGNDRTH